MGGISLNMEDDDGGIMGVSGGLEVAEEFPEEPKIPPLPAGAAAAVAPGPKECMQQPWPEHAEAAAGGVAGSGFMLAPTISSRLLK